MADVMDAICDDLAAEHDGARRDRRIDRRGATGIAPRRPPGWTVRDQIGHLAYFDRHRDGRARRSPRRSRRRSRRCSNVWATVIRRSPRSRAMTGAELLELGAPVVARCSPSCAALDPKASVPWYGPAMSAVSFATARLDGDVGTRPGRRRRARRDACRHRPACATSPTSACGARPFSYATNGQEMPEGEVRVELARARAASCGTWNESATDRRRGRRRSTSAWSSPNAATCGHRARRRGTARRGLDRDRSGVRRAAGRPAGSPGQFTSESMSLKASA